MLFLNILFYDLKNDIEYCFHTTMFFLNVDDDYNENYQEYMFPYNNVLLKLLNEKSQDKYKFIGFHTTMFFLNKKFISKEPVELEEMFPYNNVLLKRKIKRFYE